MIAMIVLGFFFFIACWIGIAELARWKVAWFNQRPILTYFLAFCLLLLLSSLIPDDMTPEQEQALENAILQELLE